ncbi:inorganic phosphate transporter [Pseudofulvimonas gallinarii]|jgi:PiT family inorganic phosphate transporter|uniref:Phosphate transporter n=1 Tax=Pseudofulvimonas gallinarii TaxID=634155 RepID=A0A4R3LKE8_9GAMM|nr:inorganic phosphate transporter [Pseudofulvimonas gallinarii]TCT00664.1 PiT family inorganic phosphate transporter [Pseudofulvimonas gallinarii]THD12025.1 phosphate permease [Pseudofulvimonas gallinarii]
MDSMTLYIALAGIFGLYMAWGIGANDVANAMATSTGAKAISMKQAFLIAAIFEFAGAVLAGGEVTATIRSGIVDASVVAHDPRLLICGMLSALLAGAIWLTVASRNGWPVSTTHTLVGAIVGFSAVGLGLDAVHWGKVGSIAMSWVISPMVAGALAYLLFRTVQYLILDDENPLRQAKRWVPVYMFFAAFNITLITMLKGLKHVGLDISLPLTYAGAVVIGLLVSLGGWAVIRRIKPDPTADRASNYATVERVFGMLMIVTACSMAFAHGSNDVSNAVGPVAAVISVASTGEVMQSAGIPPWVLLLGGAGIVVGLATYGRKVMQTVGEGITALTPSRGFAAEMAAAATTVIASGTGMPISTTHTLVGAVLGVGFARGIAAINLGVVRNIFVSWIITLPIGATLSIIIFFIFREIL